MQKFTRALTREIEVAGERLALTLNEEGVTVRPVGARRPPLTLRWDEVLCACAARAGAAAPTAEEIRAALATIRAGAPRSAADGAVPVALAPAVPAPVVAAVPPATTGTIPAPGHDLAGLLARLDTWLRQHRPRFAEGLRPGASEADLERLAEALGRPLPGELATWLRWHNGQNEDLIGGFLESWTLLSATEIAEAYRERQQENDPTWDPGWVPLLDDFQGDLVVLDTTQPGSPVREVWRGREDHAVVAPSLVEWVASFLADVETGRYHEDPERGEFRRV